MGPGPGRGDRPSCRAGRQRVLLPEGSHGLGLKARGGARDPSLTLPGDEEHRPSTCPLSPVFFSALGEAT